MAKGTGIGLGGLMLLALFGMCSDDGEYAPPDPLLSSPAQALAEPSRPVLTPIEEFYLHGSLNVRSGPGKTFPVVRTLSRGDRIRLGPKGPDGWAELYSMAGIREGHVYRASDLVRSYAPSVRPTNSGSSNGGYAPRRSSAADRGYYRGPRGGCYTYSASGRKRYVDRSLCD